MRYIQHPITHKLIPASEYVRPGRTSPYIQGDIESFVSPITGEVISDRGQLRRHNAQHGVTDSRDYSETFMAQRQRDIASKEQRAEKQDRLNDLNRAFQ